MMRLRRLALLLVVGVTLLACEWRGWDRDPDRCRRNARPYECEGNAVARVVQLCVDDDHLETRKLEVTACEDGTFCSYREGVAKCLPPPSDAGASADVEADPNDAARNDAMVDGAADDGGIADDASDSGDAAER